ncbi:MAG: HAMP domain-containing sensor histidine kinase [Polyangiaceae bacterium]
MDARDYEARRVEAEHIAFITHELRNPLGTAMLTATQLADAPAAKRSRLWELLHRSHRRLRDLVDSVLVLEEVATSQVLPVLAEITLGELLGPLLVKAELAARAKGLVFMATVDPDLVAWVDRKLATSALQNVVDNAIKYSDEGKVAIVVVEQPAHVVVHVYDSCEGLSEEELAVVFEPFRRGRFDKSGSGLGLAIAQRALLAQGGSIGGESTGEGGCHFWLTLPKAARP